MDKTYVILHIHSDMVVFEPPCPRVEAKVEQFQALVNWQETEGKWKKVTVKNFADGAGNAVNVSPLSHEWIYPNDDSRYFLFPWTDISYFCKYDVILEDDSGNTFSIDPVVLIKKPGAAFEIA